MTWAVVIDGHQFDLLDWKDFLQAPFDPTVEVVDLPDGTGGTTKAYLLKASEFASCTNPNEVREAAIPLVRTLNALAAIHNGNQPVDFTTVVQQKPDGSFLRHSYMKLEAGMAWSRGAAIGTTVGGQPQEPQPSFVQKALITANGDLLGALEHFSRADNWHDLYKTFEAVVDHVGGRSKLLVLVLAGETLMILRCLPKSPGTTSQVALLPEYSLLRRADNSLPP